MRLPVLALAAGFSLAGGQQAALAQAVPLTSDPQRFRPLEYRDLRDKQPQTATFREIWSDLLARNNRTYEEQGDLRYVGGTAPASVAHYTIWTASKVAVFSVLDTITACENHLSRPDIGISVKLCPMRVAFYENGRKTVTAGPKVCYLEWTDAARAKADPYRSVAYAAYDKRAKALSISMTVDHLPLLACSFTIPLGDEAGR